MATSEHSGLESLPGVTEKGSLSCVAYTPLGSLNRTRSETGCQTGASGKRPLSTKSYLPLLSLVV